MKVRRSLVVGLLASLVVGLTVCLAQLAAGAGSFGNQSRAFQQHVARAAPQADLKRRVDDLEKQVTSLTKELETLRKKSLSAAAPVLEPEVRIFALRQLNAVEVVETLQQLFPADKEKKIRITASVSTNSVLVLAGNKDMETISAILARLEATRDLRNGAHEDRKP